VQQILEPRTLDHATAMFNAGHGCSEPHTIHGENDTASADSTLIRIGLSLASDLALKVQPLVLQNHEIQVSSRRLSKDFQNMRRPALETVNHELGTKNCSTERISMKHLLLASATLALAAVPALATEATFERTLSASGHVELSINTGSGHIHLKEGSGNQVHVFARVKSGWGGNDEKVREIAANPPIEQTGNIIRIGTHHENLHNISIDYDIEAPADAYLDAGSGSGDVTDSGVGENAKLNTGSGSIHATGLKGNFTVNTGSGDIYAEQSGSGDVRAETGSGSIELKNLKGALKAETGSGDIKVGGDPTSTWHVQTGSGSVELWAGNAPLTLDAETGSGNVHTDHEMLTQGSSDKHHVTGKLNGGGPTVHVVSGSGDIRVH
jgi:hypothetical protein